MADFSTVKFVAAGVLAAFLAGLAGSSPAFATDLTRGPESAVYLAPVSYNGALAGIVGDGSVEGPTYSLAQWNNPDPLAAGTIVAAGVNWAVKSPTLGVNFYHGAYNAKAYPESSYEISQNGNSSGHVLPCGAEFDAFLGANDGTTYRTPSGAPAPSDIAQSGPVGNLSVVNVKVGLNIASEQIRNTCAVNYAGYTASIILSSTQGYTLFVQVFMRDSRGDDLSNTPCVGYPQGKSYCFSTSAVHLTRQPNQGVGAGRVAYVMNVLPAVQAAIDKTGDRTQNDWSVTGAYFGSLIQGGVSLTAAWDGFGVTAY